MIGLGYGFTLVIMGFLLRKERQPFRHILLIINLAVLNIFRGLKAEDGVVRYIQSQIYSLTENPAL